MILRCLQSLAVTFTGRTFAPGTHGGAWVTYAFHPGYSFVGGGEDGTRFCAHAPHALFDWTAV